MSTASPLPLAPRGTHAEVELGTLLQPKFGPDGLIPCITVDHVSNEVLMFAHMNAEALAQTVRRGRAVYWSRSRKELWEKGQESGNVQIVKDLFVDCDQDVILLKVENVGGVACHNGYKSCFYRRLAAPAPAPAPAGSAVSGSPADSGPPPLQLVFAAERVIDPAKLYAKKT
jgi:phosphoribosyl-AMP cyclohydrolase